MSLHAWAANRDPAHFHAAAAFLPERWLPDALTDAKSPYARDRRDGVLPFSVGTRACLGRRLAYAEMRLVLARLVWAFALAPAEDPWRMEDLRTVLLWEQRPVREGEVV